MNQIAMKIHSQNLSSRVNKSNMNVSPIPTHSKFKLVHLHNFGNKLEDLHCSKLNTKK